MPRTTAARIAANRRNARHSTGPRTAQGKRRSSHNALIHGLCSQVVVLPTEDPTLYQSFAKKFLASLAPATPAERALAQTIVDAQWRLNRIRPIEDALFATGRLEGVFESALASALRTAAAFHERSQAFLTLTLYEQRIDRALQTALHRLQQLQTIRNAQTTQGLRPNGFVHANALPQASKQLISPLPPNLFPPRQYYILNEAQIP
jgi:hypothetical protein